MISWCSNHYGIGESCWWSEVFFFCPSYRWVLWFSAVDDGIWTWFHIIPRKCFFFEMVHGLISKIWFVTISFCWMEQGLELGWGFFQLGKWWSIDHNKSWMECWVTRMRAFPQDINQLAMQTFNLIIVKFKDICHFGRIPDCLLRITGTSGTRRKTKRPGWKKKKSEFFGWL